MDKLIRHTIATLIYPFAVVVVTLKSEFTRIKSLGKHPKVLLQLDYTGQPIILMALYQKGKLRPDCIRLLKAAQDQGFYVIAVNTLRLTHPSQMEGLADCYIEKFNFGRDFSSYKTGFLHIFKNGWVKSCPRLMMVNDSIFFTRDRVPDFLKCMMSSDVEVLGSTENYEIESHLGSFCISMGNSILTHARFQKYWNRYWLTDVRPIVIYRGEMKLSRTLKKCVSDASQFRSLYNTDRFQREISNDFDLLKFALKNARTSEFAGWKRLSASDVLSFMETKFIESKYRVDEGALLQSTVETTNEQLYVHGYDDIISFLNRHLSDATEIPPETMDRIIIGMLTEVFMKGSQVHQNATVLLKMGLPFIKLDGLYRGMFNLYDIQGIKNVLHSDDAAEFQRLILERPFGGDTLRSWKHAAFSKGLI